MEFIAAKESKDETVGTRKWVIALKDLTTIFSGILQKCLELWVGKTLGIRSLMQTVWDLGRLKMLGKYRQKRPGLWNFSIIQIFYQHHYCDIFELWILGVW